MKKTTKPKALWTTLRAGKAQLAKAAKVKATKLAQKAVARRIAPMKRIAPMSERTKSRNAEYRKVRAAHLSLYPWCEACSAIDGLHGPQIHMADDVHHSRGKLGSLLCDTRFFKSVCRKSHTWIDANRDKARELGLLCKRGEWNRQSNNDKLTDAAR